MHIVGCASDTKSHGHFYRDSLNSLRSADVVARMFYLLMLNCSAWRLMQKNSFSGKRPTHRFGERGFSGKSVGSDVQKVDTLPEKKFDSFSADAKE